MCVCVRACRHRGKREKASGRERELANFVDLVVYRVELACFVASVRVCVRARMLVLVSVQAGERATGVFACARVRLSIKLKREFAKWRVLVCCWCLLSLSGEMGKRSSGRL